MSFIEFKTDTKAGAERRAKELRSKGYKAVVYREVIDNIVVIGLAKKLVMS